MTLTKGLGCVHATDIYSFENEATKMITIIGRAEHVVLAVCGLS